MRLPSAWFVTGVAACLGAAVGGGIVMLEAALRPWRAGDFTVASRPTGPAAVAEVPETQFAFGTVGVGAKGFHEFVIRNAGAAPLELTKGATSCTCTVSDFEEKEGGSTGPKVVPPGGSTKLKVQWRGKGDGGPFRQQASVLTNDPARPQIAFVVEGTVVPTYKAVPPFITLPKLSTSSSERATVTFFTFGQEQPTVESVTPAEEKTAAFYTLQTTPLEPAALTAETGATGGFLVTADILPGLPIGPLRQTIKVVFRMPEEVVAEIPVEGSVAGDLALAGTAWDSAREALLLGTVPSRSGTQTNLFLTAKGPHRAAVKPVVREVVPDSLQVVVGEGKPVGSGNVIRIPLSITIPPGSSPANHICSTQAPAGKIVLDTGHPDSPTLTIPVCLAIIP
ncbi:MAG: DUF1573 domain-containing protein [Planctomycetia bacterium]